MCNVMNNSLLMLMMTCW